MNATYIVTSYVVIDDLLSIMNHTDASRATISSAEILTVAVVAAKFFQNHHERALCLLQQTGYLPKLSVSRFNRRLHALQDVLLIIVSVLGEMMATGQVFVIDTMPVPVCKRVRAERCRKVQGDDFLGYCASKREYYFGWQLHLVCDAAGVPVSFELLPARWDELTLVQALLSPLPEGSVVVADKGYISDKDQQLSYINGRVRLVPKQRRNMTGNTIDDAALIRAHRPRIETVNSQLEKMGLQRLHARTNPGFALKVLASLLALTFTNVI
ncbi:MAG: IS982 family transposase [Anaerolineae bacterium]|nr:IS982 family transposase [Anaerolineae bacterium]